MRGNEIRGLRQRRYGVPVEQSRRRQTGRAPAPQPGLQLAPGVPVAGRRYPHDPVGRLRAGVGVDHRVVARDRLGRQVGLGQDPARLGQRDAQRELADQPGAPPQRLDPGHVLAGQDQMDALRAAAPGQVLQQRGGLGGGRAPAGQQHLELVDHRDDPGPVPVRILGAQLGQGGHLVPLGRRRAVLQDRSEVAQQRQPELPVGVHVDPDQADVRQPARVAPARREAGEGHALLEVEQVELQLGRGVPGGERAQPGVDEVGLAGAGRAGDHRVRRVVGEGQVDQPAVGTLADRRGQPGRGGLRPLPCREQVGERRRLRAGGHLRGEGTAGGGDQLRVGRFDNQRYAPEPPGVQTLHSGQ